MVLLAIRPLQRPRRFFSWHIGGNITSLESVAAVPETSTWMMLILGFAMVGFALRKRNSSQTAMKEKMFTFMQNKEGAMHAPSASSLVQPRVI